MIQKDDVVVVLGGHGMAGSAIYRAFRSSGFANVLKPERSELDLLNRLSVEQYLQRNGAMQVIMAAGKVGGIVANMKDQSGFFTQNMRMSMNTIESSHKSGVQNLIYLGSSCVYPKFAEQPIKESSLLTGSLEPTNEGYALAKIAGIKLCSYYSETYGRNYFSIMPSNLYGPGDNYHQVESHVLPALIRRIHEAKLRGEADVTVWGSGKPLREFMHVDDLASAVIHLAQTEQNPELVNAGSGEEVTIAELARIIADVIGFKGEIQYDLKKPDGTPRKLLDPSYLSESGWKGKIDLRKGIERTYQDFLSGNVRNIS